VTTDGAFAVAVLVPCLNEATAIARVVGDFRAVLPDAVIYVYDNGSTDQSVERARDAGAVVRREPRRGKGNVVRRMFAEVDADVYLLVDGDATYDPASAPAMLALLANEHLDMVTARRIAVETGAYRSWHTQGNRMLTGVVARLFGQPLGDMLSGYRVMSKRLVKSFPALSSGFEIETELTVHAMELRMPIAEMDSPYGARGAGSSSKLSTFRDGWRIARTILTLLRAERPLAFFGGMALVLGLTSLFLGVGLWSTYLRTGLVPRFPTAILATGLMLSALISMACGLILDTVTTGRREMKRLLYLRIPLPGTRLDRRRA
jgi:glycosyltransferase involved in cell wall biosynthesis